MKAGIINTWSKNNAGTKDFYLTPAIGFGKYSLKKKKKNVPNGSYIYVIFLRFGFFINL